MKERPILFSAPMVRALLAGTKTVTRRIVKSPHVEDASVWKFNAERGLWESGIASGAPGSFGHGEWVRCPYGVAGDRLWVRETWRVFGGREYEYQHDPSQVIFRADPDATDGSEWRPSIFMPRWASRIELEVVSIGIEQLHTITEAEAKAEGVEPLITTTKVYPSKLAADVEHRSYRGGYEKLWNEINGASSWRANPWVWAVTFKRVEQQR